VEERPEMLMALLREKAGNATGSEKIEVSPHL